MTRFARAKGSKASNERVHDEPTPWHVMKQQLESAVATKEIKEKTKTANELLKEKDDVFYGDTVGNLNTDWAEFEPEKSTNTPKTPKPGKQNKIKNLNEDSPVVSDELAAPEKKSKKRKSEVSLEPLEKEASEPTKEPPAEIKVPSPKKIKTDNNSPGNKLLQNHLKTIAKAEKNKKRRQEKKLKIKARILENKNENNDEKKDNAIVVEGTNDNNVKEKKETSDDKKSEEKLSKRQKRNRKNKLKNEENESANKPEEKSSDNSGPRQNGNPNFPHKNNFPNSNDNLNNNLKRKLPKVRDDLAHKRRKPEPPSQKVIINGMEVEIVHYDGFPVKKEDATRLKDLRAQMVLKGIPKDQINAAMKLERRKAEKALTKIKKCVCFHCRKAGHNLSDCPELGKEEVATGICFKCGSTEHTHFECKVIKKDDYKFAKCFICREQGHVAKQCPDNPKGLYPQGGACKICGDVTHLRKDCPDLQLDKEDDTMKLDTIGNSNLESLDDDLLSRKKKEEPKKPEKQVVKF